MAEEGRNKFNNRPESTIAQNFAADLDSMFGLNPGVERLTQTVEEKKQHVSSGEQELQELEARLRDTEQRLARVSRQNSPSRRPQGSQSTASSDAAAKPSPLAQKPSYPPDRPPTAGEARRNERVGNQAMATGRPGAGPQAPGQQNGSNDYVMVETGGEADRAYT